jgi:hypothetical protein
MTILRLTNGTLTANLIWHSAANRKYMLARDGWAPKVAKPRASLLEGAGPYAEVDEELTLHVLGDSDAEVLANLGTLNTLLTNAARWANEEAGISPVVLQYTPEGSDLLLQRVVLGRAPGDQTEGVELPVTFSRELRAYLISNLTLRMVCRGLWLEPSVQAQSAGANNPNVMTATFAASAAVPSPMEVRVGNFNTTTMATALTPSYLIATNTANNLLIIEAEACVDSTSAFTTFADAANRARGGSVMRLIVSGTSPRLKGTIPGTFTAKRIAIFGVMKLTSGALTTHYTLIEGYGVTATLPRPLQTIDVNPTLVFLGVAQLPNGATSFTMHAIATAANAFYVDYFVVVGLDDQFDTHIVSFPNASDLSGFALASSVSALSVDPGALTRPVPFTGIIGLTSSIERTLASRGDASIHMRGTTVAATWLATGGTNWVAVDTTPAVIAAQIIVNRTVAHLIPE